MSQDAEIVSLMNLARDRAGSDAALARILRRRHQDISDMRHGRKAATPEDCALFAMVAGLDPVAEMARAAVRKHEGTPKGDMLMRALGKASLATGGVIASAGAHAAAIFGTGHDWSPLSDFLRCIQGRKGRRRFAFA